MNNFQNKTKSELMGVIKNLQNRVDSWTNLMTGLGMEKKDKRYYTEFGGFKKMTESYLSNLYRGEGYAKKIIDYKAEDMIRKWFNVEGDTEGYVNKRFEELEFKKILTKALTWNGLFGGSVIVMIIDDESYELKNPLNENNIKSIESFQVYDRFRVNRIDINKDEKSKNFGEPEIYRINTAHGNTFSVHSSRTLVFTGIDIPDKDRKNNNGWGDSELQSVHDRLKGMGETLGSIETIIAEFIIGVFTIDNLGELIASGEEKLIHKRLNQIDMAKHILNSVLIDKDEKYDRISATVSGLDALTELMMQNLSAVSGIPMTRLFGQAPRGLAANKGEADIRNYYDHISARQECDLLPIVKKATKLVMLEKEGKFGGKELENWSINFNPLWQLTEEELTETRKTQAETDQIYIETGVLSSTEVSKSRFGGNKYSYETKLLFDREIEE